MSKPTITHRSALTTTLSAIGVGLMAAAGTRPERVAAEQFAVPTTLATVVNADDLAAEARSLFDEASEYRERAADLERRLAMTLTPAQAELQRAVCDAHSNEHTVTEIWQSAELARHLPGLAPVIRMVWEHVVSVAYQNPGDCCTVAAGFEP